MGGGDPLGARHILRRLKTDKSVIADLPDKTEVKAATEAGLRRSRETVEILGR